MNQYTIEKAVSCAGIGLHGGQKVHLCFHPAQIDTGILFLRYHGNEKQYIKVCPQHVVDTQFSTTIGVDGINISTVEHVLAAVRGLGIDNLIIEVDGDEVPILDGSSVSFVYLLRQAGVQKQKMPKRVLSCVRKLSFEDGERRIVLSPYNGLRIRYHIEFSHPMIGQQHFDYVAHPEEFVRSLSRARTFGFMHDIEMLHQSGLIQGGSLENALVFDESGVVNSDGLRFSDEPVRHKLLDFIGDIGIYSDNLLGCFDVWCSGHGFNNRFLRYLEANAHIYLKPVQGKVKKVNENIKQEQWAIPAFF